MAYSNEPQEDLAPLAETWGELMKLSPQERNEDLRRYLRRAELEFNRRFDEKHPDIVDTFGV